jgi:hypothetical protein
MLDTARNDRESFQLCLRPYGRDISNAKVTISDLVGDKGKIPASNITWNRVGYVWVETPLQHPNTPRHEGAWWPDPLLAPVPFNIKMGEVQPLWFTVYVPEDTKPGVYLGTVSVQSENEQPVKAYIRITVHSAKIPVTGYMKTAFALMDGFMANLYGNVTPELRRAYTDFLLQHRLNPDDISRITYPDLDELSYANTRGLNAFNILNVVPVPDKKVTWVCYGELKDYTPEFKKQFFERLDKIVPELQKRGQLDKAYIYGFDERFKVIGQGYVGPVPVPVIIMIICFAIGSFILNKTYFGRYFYAVGGNEEAAKLSGIRVGRIKYLIYALGGLFSGLAGIVMLSRTNSAQPTAGIGYEFDVITCVVLGGVSVAGGIGKISNVVAGVLIIGVLTNGMVLLNVSTFAQMIIKGIVLILAVGFDCIQKRNAQH